MRYQFSPENRSAATTHVFEKHRVAFVPGIGDIDDAVWNGIKDEPEIVAMMTTETLRVLTPPATATSTPPPPIPPIVDPLPPIPPATKTTKKTADASPY